MIYSIDDPIIGESVGSPAEVFAWLPAYSVDDAVNMRLANTETNTNLSLRHSPRKGSNLVSNIRGEPCCLLESRVITMGHGSHVIGIDAGTVRATRTTVIRDVPIGERSESIFKVNTVRSVVPTVLPKPTVPIRIQAKVPNPAAGLLINGVRGFGIWLGSHVVTNDEGKRFTFDVSELGPIPLSYFRKSATSAPAIDGCIDPMNLSPLGIQFNAARNAESIRSCPGSVRSLNLMKRFTGEGVATLFTRGDGTLRGHLRVLSWLSSPGLFPQRRALSSLQLYHGGE